jgi:hypothetical protein
VKEYLHFLLATMRVIGHTRNCSQILAWREDDGNGVSRGVGQ